MLRVTLAAHRRGTKRPSLHEEKAIRRRATARQRRREVAAQCRRNVALPRLTQHRPPHRQRPGLALGRARRHSHPPMMGRPARRARDQECGVDGLSRLCQDGRAAA